MADDSATFSAWLLEFIVRHVDDDLLTTALMTSLPLPSTLPRNLLRAIFLRRLASDLSRCLPSLPPLQLLLEHRFDTSSFSQECLAAAYRTVALDCLAATFRSGSDRSYTILSEDLSATAAKLERTQPSAPAQYLKDLLLDIEKASQSRAAKDALFAKDFRGKALDLISDYLKSARKELGPSFLEQVAESVAKNHIKLGDHPLIGDNSAALNGAVAVTVESEERPRSAKEKQGPSFHEQSAELIAKNAIEPGDPSIGKKNADSSVAAAISVNNALRPSVTREEVGPSLLQQFAELIGENAIEPGGPSVSEKNADSSVAAVVENEPSSASLEIKKSNFVSTPAYEMVAKNLRLSCTDLQRVVADPLNDALTQANEALKTRSDDPPNCDLMEQMVWTANIDDVIEERVDGANNMTQIYTKETENPPVDKVQKPSLMDKNPSAQVYEVVDDAVGPSIDQSPTSATKIRLQTPRVSKPSPLPVEKNMNRLRRKKRRWSVEEEDALREAVAKLGRGNWKKILNENKDTFDERTEVDLKDKWRNMTR